MMFDVHPLHPSRPSPSQKLNRENRIKNACLSNSHSNIAASNDKRPLFMQIPATPSASLVSTSLPVKCIRPSNFFFYRRIFPNSFLRHQILITHQLILARLSSNFGSGENCQKISLCKRRSQSVVDIGQVTKWKRAKRLRLLESAQTKGACHLRLQCYYDYLKKQAFLMRFSRFSFWLGEGQDERT